MAVEAPSTGFTPEQMAYLQSLQAPAGPQAKTGGTKLGGGMGSFSPFGMGALGSKGMQKELDELKKIQRLSDFARDQAGLQRGYVTTGTGEARQSLMEGFRRAYAQRAAGVAGAYGQQADQLGSELLGQGLSADIARRMMAGQRGAALQQLGEAQGAGAADYYSALAQLQKGTAGELAAISQAETEQYLAPQIARLSGEYAMKAGKAQGRGSLLGGLLGGIGSVVGGAL